MKDHKVIVDIPAPVAAAISKDKPGEIVARTLPSNVSLLSLEYTLPGAQGLIKKFRGDLAAKRTYEPEYRDNLLALATSYLPNIETFYKAARAGKSPELGVLTDTYEELKDVINTLKALA